VVGAPVLGRDHAQHGPFHLDREDDELTPAQGRQGVQAHRQARDAREGLLLAGREARWVADHHVLGGDHQRVAGAQAQPPMATGRASMAEARHSATGRSQRGVDSTAAASRPTAARPDQSSHRRMRRLGMPSDPPAPAQQTTGTVLDKERAVRARVRSRPQPRPGQWVRPARVAPSCPGRRRLVRNVHEDAAVVQERPSRTPEEADADGHHHPRLTLDLLRRRGLLAGVAAAAGRRSPPSLLRPPPRRARAPSPSGPACSGASSWAASSARRTAAPTGAGST
jgi:hypothetical protein